MDWSKIGFSGKQTQKVLNALWKNDWVDGLDLMMDYNLAARSRISEIRRSGISIESKKGKNRTYEYHLTKAGRDEILKRLEV